MGLTRRSLLAGSTALVAVAGCIEVDPDDDPAADPADDESIDDTTDDATADDVDDETTADDVDDDATTTAATVTVDSHPEHGDILVDGDGMTLYNFDADAQGSEESACHDDCLANWPPLLAEDEPTGGDGVTAELATFERADGDTQVAADGWPLYYFAGDDAPGDANGQGVNDVWWVLAPDGTVLRDDVDDDSDEDPPEDDDDEADDDTTDEDDEEPPADDGDDGDDGYGY